MIVEKLKSVRNFINYRDDDSGNPLSRFISDIGKIRNFSSTLGFLMDAQWRSEEWHSEYQDKRLRELLAYAAGNVPFYRDFTNNNKIDVENNSARDILKEFPVIDVSELRSGFERFVPENVSTKDDIILELGEESGDAINVPVDRQTLMLDKAMVARQYESSGYRIGSPASCFVNSIQGSEGQAYRFDKANNRHYMAMNYLNRKNLADFCGRVKDSKADFVFGYPSSLELFADYILEWEIEMKFLGVITSGEVLTDKVRYKIERAFYTKVYDLYRFSLPITGMGQCQYCDGYHLFSEYSVMELVDFDGNVVEEEGKLGRIVVTNTSNRAFPIIRLDTGDVGVYDGKRCDCGRGNPRVVNKISGSRKELLIGADGRYLSPGSLKEILSDAGFPAAGYQLIQTGKNRFELRITSRPDCEAEVLDKIKADLREKLGKSSEIHIEPVVSIDSEMKKARSIVREYQV